MFFVKMFGLAQKSFRNFVYFTFRSAYVGLIYPSHTLVRIFTNGPRASQCARRDATLVRRIGALVAMAIGTEQKSFLNVNKC